MKRTNKYEMLVLLKEDFNDNELKSWAFNYAKTLQQLNASEISVISRGKLNLSYYIKNQKKGNFIQINFSSIGSFIQNFSTNLKLDNNVLRFLILKKP